MGTALRDKFYGCICGGHIGSAMGAPVEGMSYPEIEEKFGFVDKFLPYMHYGNGWMREPGTTEDGVERQKLMITAIMEKGDRITAEDVRKAWDEHANPNAGGWVSEPFEGTLLQIARTGIPATDLGRYCDYAGLNSFSRACHAIGTDQCRKCGDCKGRYSGSRTALPDGEQPRTEMGLCHWYLHCGRNEAGCNRKLCFGSNLFMTTVMRTLL